MRTIRGLQITSLLVLSPVLICLIALVSIIFVPVYSSFISWCRLVMPELNIPRLNYSSIITWMFALLISYHYTAVKEYFSQNTSLTTQVEPMPEPFETEKNAQKKQPKKKKAKKTKHPIKIKRKDEEKKVENGMKIKLKEQILKEEEDEEEEEEEWIDARKVKGQNLSNEKDIKSSDDNENHSLMISPEITPQQSEDETNNVKTKGWYSPFSTGLDLDILPKFTMDPLCQYKINFTPPSSPLIPNLLQQNQHQQHSSPKQSIIELLENHPFISTNHSHHQQHILGPIGENKSKAAPK